MRRFLFVVFLASASACVPACVPADGTFGLGSAEFTIKASRPAQFGFTTTLDSRPWEVSFDRIILGFRTMTIGKVGDDDRCAFRGRGEKSDIVFDPRETLVQTFNGIAAAACEDTGIFLSPPGDTTEVGPGATSADLVELARGDQAHALIDATARQDDHVLKIHFRFDTGRTASRFGGCIGAIGPKGIVINPNQRTLASATFHPENMFQDSLGFGGSFRVDAFERADFVGDRDGEFTMADAEKLSLLGLGGGYQLPNGTTAGSFADFLRALFRFTFRFREVGTCVGNEPGTEE